MPSNFPARNVYIAAKFKADQLPDEFTLGDGVEYGGFTNRPLDVDFTYRVFLRAYTVERVRSVKRRNCDVKLYFDSQIFLRAYTVERVRTV
jgi:hypothetical protein